MDEPKTQPSGPPLPPLTDSPWFWVYVFATGGLIALSIMSPKYAQRQALEERKFQARMRARELAQGEEPTTALSSEDNLIITLQPLYIALGAVFIGSWILIWRHRIARRQREAGAVGAD